MRTNIYIDGFNFYYLAVRGTKYKWLDFKSLMQKLLGNQNQIGKIKYFTSIVSATTDDPQKPIRQLSYIHALSRFIPEIEVYRGHFMSHEVLMPLVTPTTNQKFVKVIKTEEKGTDVNLAVHLVNDAWLDRFECAVIVSNDSDLTEAIRIVKEERHKRIGIIHPGGGYPSKQLLQYADFIKRIRKGLLSSSQLPDQIPNTTIRKPSSW